MSFTMLFQLRRDGQCTYPFFSWIFFTSTPHNTLSKPLAAYPGSGWVDPRVRPMFFPRIDYGHCDRVHSSLTAAHCFGNGYLGKQAVAWKEYCAEYLFKELMESMNRCTGRRDITEMLLKTAVNTIQSIKL